MASRNDPPSGRGRNRGSTSRSRGQKTGPGRKGGGSRGGPPKAGGRGATRDRSSARSGQRSDTGRSRSGGRRSGGAPRKYAKGKPSADPRDEGNEEGIPGNQNWGGLARKGVLRANQDERAMAERKGDRLEDELDDEALAKRAEREHKRAEREARQADLREQARSAVERANKGEARRSPSRSPRPRAAKERAPLPSGPPRHEDEVEALNRLLGPAEAKKQIRKLRTAADSFTAERYADAQKSLKALVELAPSVPEIRELYGLTLYRQGRYRAAADQLEKFRVLAASVDQNPVLQDCYRAQERWADVAELWHELADASPGADLVNEGRIVMAGALADQGDVDGAVRLLEKGWKRLSRPRDHHLRRAYALADLYERSGNVPRARALFDWVLKHDPGFVDTRRRLENLS